MRVTLFKSGAPLPYHPPHYYQQLVQVAHTELQQCGGKVVVPAFTSELVRMVRQTFIINPSDCVKPIDQSIIHHLQVFEEVTSSPRKFRSGRHRVSGGGDVHYASIRPDIGQSSHQLGNVVPTPVVETFAKLRSAHATNCELFRWAAALLKTLPITVGIFLMKFCGLQWRLALPVHVCGYFITY